eukprot:COSAG06_NODE_1570_length_9069_cov_2.920067_2_plen_513_part_00
MDALIGGMGCDSGAGNPLGNLVDGFLDRQRVAEQMGEGMVGGMMGPNAAMMGQTMMGEGAMNLGMFGPQSMAGGGLDVNDFLAASQGYGAQDAAFAQMDAAMASAQMGGPSMEDFAAFQQMQGPGVEDFMAFQAAQGPSLEDFAAFQAMQGPSMEDFAAFQAMQGPSVEDFMAFEAMQGPSVADFAAFQGMQGPSVADFAAFQGQQGPSVAEFAAFQGQQGPSVADFQSFQGAQGPSVADFQSFQAEQGPSVADFQAFQQEQGPSVADFQAFQQAQGPSVADFQNFQQNLGPSVADFENMFSKRAYDKPYSMAENNPFANLDALGAMAEGIRLFNEGDLAGAKMAFERSVSEDATNAEGWRWLGTCNQDSDDDVKSIMCLLQAVEVDPGNLKAHLGLGVSFTNELENARALQHLRAYIENNPTYAPLAATATGETEHDRVVDMFMQAAAQAPEDPQPRTVLGVLYNLSREYDKAVECFKAALEVDPTDYSLWCVRSSCSLLQLTLFSLPALP